MKNKYVYRAVAVYEDVLLDTTRDFLTKKTRDQWAAQRLRGYPEEHGGLLGADRPAIPPARKVYLSRSKPLIFEKEKQ